MAFVGSASLAGIVTAGAAAVGAGAAIYGAVNQYEAAQTQKKAAATNVQGAMVGVQAAGVGIESAQSRVRGAEVGVAGAELGVTAAETGVRAAKINVAATEVEKAAALFTGESQARQYEFMAAIAKRNAVIQNQNADFALSAGEVTAEQSGMQTRYQIGLTKSTQAASGLDVNRGTAVNVRESEALVGQQNTGIIRANAARTAFAYNADAANFLAQADLDVQSAATSRTAGALGALAADYKKRGAEIGVEGAEEVVKGARLGVTAAKLGVEGAQLGVKGAKLGVTGAELGVTGAAYGIPAAGYAGAAAIASGVGSVSSKWLQASAAGLFPGASTKPTEPTA